MQLARDAKDALAVGMRRAMGASPAVPVDRSTADETAIESGLISQFLAGLQIVPEKSTRLVAIVYTAPSAEFAALAANTVAEEYAQQNLDLRLDAINKNAALSAQCASVIDAARNEYESALIEERSLGSQLEGQKTAAMDLDRKSGRYLVLQREAESNRSVYQALLQQEKELRVVSNSRNNNVQLMDRAEIPGAPFSPNARRDWFTALLAGLLAAVGLAFLLEYLDDTVGTPEDVSKRLNLALLGIVPAVRGPSVPLLSEQVPLEFGEGLPVVEDVDRVYQHRQRPARCRGHEQSAARREDDDRLQPGDGTGHRRFARAAGRRRHAPGGTSQAGRRREREGLSHLLAGQAHVRDVIQPTREPNRFVIPAGLTPPNPSELLSSDRMRVFLNNLQTGPFDWVIVDTPPVLAVTDAVIVTRVVSGVVFVIGSEMTRRVHAERALEILMTARPRSIGCVLNRVDFQRNNYYYSRYYGYHYQNYYRQTTASA